MTRGVRRLGRSLGWGGWVLQGREGGLWMGSLSVGLKMEDGRGGGLACFAWSAFQKRGVWMEGEWLGGCVLVGFENERGLAREVACCRG